MRENTDQKNTEYGHFLRSVIGEFLLSILISETYSEPSRISTMELFAKIVNAF